MFLFASPLNSLKTVCNEYAYKRLGAEMRKKAIKELFILTTPIMKTKWHPDEGPEDSTTMQEIDETLNAGQGGI